MAIAENAIFKFVSLHRPNNGLIIDPTYDVPDNDVEERLQDLDVSPANASDDVIDLLDEDALAPVRAVRPPGSSLNRWVRESTRSGSTTGRGRFGIGWADALYGR